MRSPSVPRVKGPGFGRREPTQPMRGAFLLLFLFSALAALTGSASANGATGGVHVSTLPADADVWLDGTYVGRSPVLVEGLEGGRHTLAVIKSGWVSQELSIDIAADAIAMASVRLAAAAHPSHGTGAYLIHKTPPGAQVSVDGQPAPADGREAAIAAGTHRLTISTAKSANSIPLVIYPDTTTVVAFLGAATSEAPRTSAAVIAPCSDYLPDGSYTVAGGRFVVHWAGHEVDGTIGVAPLRFDGVTVSYDAAPTLIAGRLYLPLALLEKLAGKSAKAK
jgi:hypothetical protein